MNITYRWRAPVDNAALGALHAEGFNHVQLDEDWNARNFRRTASAGSPHTTSQHSSASSTSPGTAPSPSSSTPSFEQHLQRHGVATELIKRAETEARKANCEWLHVDFEAELRPFYLDVCGFRPTPAGLIAL